MVEGMASDANKLQYDYYGALKLAKKRHSSEYYHLIAMNNLRKARVALLMAGNTKASNLVQSLIDVLRPYGIISEEDEQ